MRAERWRGWKGFKQKADPRSLRSDRATPGPAVPAIHHYSSPMPHTAQHLSLPINCFLFTAPRQTHLQQTYHGGAGWMSARRAPHGSPHCNTL